MRDEKLKFATLCNVSKSKGNIFLNQINIPETRNMARSILLKKIVFCFVLFFCQPSTGFLETGYKYSRYDLITKDSLYNDLKCAYLFSGLTHMLIIQIIIAPPYNLPTNHTVISDYSYLVKHQIASLYRLNKRRMGSLWLIHFYINLLHGLSEHSEEIQADYLIIVATHEYVIKKMSEDVRECRKGNYYDSFYKMMESNPHSTEEELKQLVYKNYDATQLLLKHNKICSKLYNDKFIESLRIRSIFMNGMGSRTKLIRDLMNVFNVQVSWSDITDRFKKSLLDARKLDWTNDNLQNIKTYYMLNYSFLKIIMFRLTLKHMTYLKDYLEGSEHYVYYARYWYIVVEKFGSMLSLTNDLHVKNLLTSIFNLSDGTEKLDSVFSYVISILFSLCLPLGCKAIEPFNIDNKEFEIPYESSMNDIIIRSENITTSRVPIEYNSLENTRIFLLYIDHLFKNVDFSLIKLLIEYIDEIKLKNDMERFESSHLGSSDFDYL